MNKYTSEELAEARAIAEAATEGPWRAVETMVQSARGEALADCGHEGEPEEQDFIDAEHIAKFDPKFVIGLLDEVKRMTSDRCAKNLSMMSRELSEAKAEIERLNSTEKYLREKARDEHLARIESDEEDATEYLAMEQELAEANAELEHLRSVIRDAVQVLETCEIMQGSIMHDELIEAITQKESE